MRSQQRSSDAVLLVTYLARPADKPARSWHGRLLAASVASLAVHLLALFVAVAPLARPDAAPVPQALDVRVLDTTALPPRAKQIMTPAPGATARQAPVPRSEKPATANIRSTAWRRSPDQPDQTELVEPWPAAPPAPPTAPEPLLAARFAAHYLSNPEPTYPAMSRRLGEQGSVVLSVRVSVQGDVLAVEVNRSSGHARLDDAAIAAVERWRFVPARRGDAAVESTVVVPLRFSLGK